jgi:hypothetical protein
MVLVKCDICSLMAFDRLFKSCGCHKPNAAEPASVSSYSSNHLSGNTFGSVRHAFLLPSIFESAVRHPDTFCPCSTDSTIETIP